MHVHILSIFPTIVENYLNESIMKRAQEKWLLSYTLYNIADWTVKHTRRVDDRPYGWWPGTILMVEPLYNLLHHIEWEHGKQPILFFSPRWNRLTQQRIEIFAKEHDSYILICGHYEGVDERIFSLFPIEEISIGDFVISSGELALLVWIDSVTRLLPWVIHEDSLREETFSEGIGRKKEYPQYTRPQTFRELAVPDVLMRGDKEAIRQWNHTHTS